jgi:hypothetical protein
VPTVNDKRELRDFNISAPPGRILLDGYLLTFNKRTKEASITPLRTALVHYNITWVKGGDPPCEGCFTISEPIYEPAMHAIEVTIGLINNYYDNGTTYDGFDVRAIFVQIDTDGDDQFVYDHFDLVYPECDSTDLYTDDWGMPYDPDKEIEGYGGTNPFYQFYKANDPYEDRDRALPYGDSYWQTFILAINDEPDYGAEDILEQLE